LSFSYQKWFVSERADTKKNLAIKVLWKIIRQIKGFTLLIRIISFNFADTKQTGGLLLERAIKNGFATEGTLKKQPEGAKQSKPVVLTMVCCSKEQSKMVSAFI